MTDIREYIWSIQLLFFRNPFCSSARSSFSSNHVDSRIFNTSAYILHGMDINDIGLYDKGLYGSMFGFGTGIITLFTHSCGTSLLVKQQCIILCKRSIQWSIRKSSLGISSTPTDLFNFDRKTAFRASSLVISEFKYDTSGWKGTLSISGLSV